MTTQGNNDNNNSITSVRKTMTINLIIKIILFFFIFRQDDANVIITVSDENDNAPVFNPLSYSIDITEGANTPRRSVITVSATDIDEGENREIVYSITRGNIGDTFSINNITVRILLLNDKLWDHCRYFRIKVKCFMVSLKFHYTGQLYQF